MEKAMDSLQIAPPVKSQAHDSDVLLGQILERLMNILKDENSKLEAGVTEDHGIFIMSKNLVLRELMSMQRTIQVRSLPQDMLDLLVATRTLVDRNNQLLKMQVIALSDVTSFLTQAAVSEQGDGTYTRERQ
jgi:hypothetical protein